MMVMEIDSTRSVLTSVRGHLGGASLCSGGFSVRVATPDFFLTGLEWSGRECIFLTEIKCLLNVCGSKCRTYWS